MNVTLEQQIKQIKILKDEEDNRYPSADALYHRALYKAILDNLLKLQTQEDLIDQQADEHFNGVSDEHLELLDRADETASAYLKAQPNTMIEAMEHEIDDIKEIVILIANKFDIDLEQVRKKTADAIDRVNTSLDKLIEVEYEEDPAVVALIGDVSKKPHTEILQMLGNIQHDIAILEALFNRGGMTVGERDGILDNAHYKTTDLDLLHSASKVLQSYLPF